MIAVNASTSPHSSESFTPFGSNALILEEPQGPAVRPSDAGWLSPRATSTSSERVSSGRPQSAAMTGINADRDDTVGNPDSLASLTHLRRTFALTHGQAQGLISKRQAQGRPLQAVPLMLDHSGGAHHAPQAAHAVSALHHSYLASTYFKWTLHAAEASVVKGAPKLALTKITVDSTTRTILKRERYERRTFR